MGRSSHASTLLINRNVVDQKMRVEGMREGEMAHPQNAEDQSKKQLAQNETLKNST